MTSDVPELKSICDIRRVETPKFPGSYITTMGIAL